jgi:hypothetical protein
VTIVPSPSTYQPDGRCRRTDCPRSTGDPGACLLAHANVLDCPEFEPSEEGPPSQTVATGAVHSDSADSNSQVLDIRGRRPIHLGSPAISVYPAQALDISQASTLLHGHASIVVLPIGRVGVGKTTLIASVYESLCEGPTNGHRFAGSESILAFEDRCHDAMWRSRRPVPDASHTSKDAKGIFLHLRLQRLGHEQDFKDLLVADISGELEDDLIRLDKGGYLGTLLACASNLAILISGEELADPNKRYAAITRARVGLRTMTERSSAGTTANIFAAITKWDKCVTAQGIQSVVERLTDELGSVSPGIKVVKTAVRPEVGSRLREGTGVSEFIAAILVPPPTRSVASPTLAPSLRRSGSFTANNLVIRNYVGATGR